MPAEHLEQVQQDHPAPTRTVLHVDMDAFFASVEVLDNPALAGQPVVVGGATQRGVVASCSYEARAYGVRSAMPAGQARARCPTAVFLRPRMARYRAVSARFREILLDVTPLVEPIGLDEAFLDVSGSERLRGSPQAVAARIRHQVQVDLGLSCAVGVGSTKLVAKLASRDAKPRADRRGTATGAGVTVVAMGTERAYLAPRPVGDLWGIGPATVARLGQLGVRTVGDVASLPPDVLTRHVGRSLGQRLVELSRGDDRRPVVPGVRARSIGHEETFEADLHDHGELAARLLVMADAVGRSLRARSLAGRAVTIKVRSGDFTTITRSRTVGRMLDTGPAIAAVGRELLAMALADGDRTARGVRLLGVSVSGLGAAGAGEQLAFALGSLSGAVAEPAEALQSSWAEVSRATDRIRVRFGDGSVRAGFGGELRGTPGGAG